MAVSEAEQKHIAYLVGAGLSDRHIADLTKTSVATVYCARQRLKTGIGLNYEKTTSSNDMIPSETVDICLDQNIKYDVTDNEIDSSYDTSYGLVDPFAELTKTRIHTQNSTLPYLQDELISEFSNIVIKSDDGTEFQLNELLFLSWSKCASDMIKDSFALDNGIVISSEYSPQELKIFCDFIMRGTLPCSMMDIVNKTLNEDLDDLFLNFGVNLYSIVTGSSFLLPQVKLEDCCKVEEHYGQGTNIPGKIEKIIINNSNLIENSPVDFKHFSKMKKHTKKSKEDAFEDYEPDIKKSKINKAKPAKPAKNNSIVANGYKCTECGRTFNRKFKLTEHMNTLHENAEKTDMDKSFRKISLSDSEDDIDSFENIVNWPCSYCDHVFVTQQECNHHINAVHYFQKIRGLKYPLKRKWKEDPLYHYCSYKSLLEYKEKYKNSFKINIPSPDFTEEMFKNFKFSTPLTELEVIPLHPAKNNHILIKPTDLKCPVCMKRSNTNDCLRNHMIEEHTVHYSCPYDQCDYAITKSKSELDTYKLARHFYLHENSPLQLSYPHECIACGYKATYLSLIDEHLKKKGLYHDNKCPKCPLRFDLRATLLNHQESENHRGYCCGLCPEVFSSIQKHERHIAIVHKKRYLR